MPTVEPSATGGQARADRLGSVFDRAVPGLAYALGDAPIRGVAEHLLQALADPANTLPPRADKHLAGIDASDPLHRLAFAKGQYQTERGDENERVRTNYCNTVAFRATMPTDGRLTTATNTRCGRPTREPAGPLRNTTARPTTRCTRCGGCSTRRTRKPGDASDAGTRTTGFVRTRITGIRRRRLTRRSSTIACGLGARPVPFRNAGYLRLAALGLGLVELADYCLEMLDDDR